MVMSKLMACVMKVNSVILGHDKPSLATLFKAVKNNKNRLKFHRLRKSLPKSENIVSI